MLYDVMIHGQTPTGRHCDLLEIYTQLYIHLCKHKITHSFDHCDCIVFRLYANLLSTHGPNLAYCAIFLNKFVNL